MQRKYMEKSVFWDKYFLSEWHILFLFEGFLKIIFMQKGIKINSSNEINFLKHILGTCGWWLVASRPSRLRLPRCLSNIIQHLVIGLSQKDRRFNKPVLKLRLCVAGGYFTHCHMDLIFYLAATYRVLYEEKCSLCQ